MVAFLVATVPAIGLLPYITVGDWGESWAIATHCTAAVLSLHAYMRSDVVLVEGVVIIVE